MNKTTKKFNPLKAGVYGVITYLLINTALLAYSYFSPQSFQFTISQFITSSIANTILDLAPLVSGVVTGYILGQQGFRYGARTGLATGGIMVAIILIANRYYGGQPLTGTIPITQFATTALKTIITLTIFMGAGGLVGEHLAANRILKKENPSDKTDNLTTDSN